MAKDTADIGDSPTHHSIDPRIEPMAASYLPELSSLIRNSFGDGPPDPDDAAQEAFRRVLQRGDTLSIHNLKGFLWRTARNLVFDAKKSEATRAKYNEDVENFFPANGDMHGPENVLIARQQLNTINELLLKMPERRRRAFMLYRVDGLTLMEVARQLKLSRTAVSKHIAKAHAEINALFIEEEEG